MLKHILCLLLAATLCCSAVYASSVTVKSPDGKIELHVSDDTDEYASGDGPLFYTVKYEGKTIIEPSRLNLKFKGLPEIKLYNSVDMKNGPSGNQTWEYPWGRQRNYLDRYSKSVFTLQEKIDSGRTFQVEFRVYNDGVAFRYQIDPQTVGADEYILEQDLSEFNFAGNPTAWYTDFGKFNSSQEKPYPKGNLAAIPPGAHVGCPVVVQISKQGPYVALTETELNHWGGLYFEGAENPNVKTLFDSQTIKAGEKAKTFNVPLDGVRQLDLMTKDGGDRNTSDHADWCSLILTKKDGTKVDLATIKPSISQQDWGALHINKSIDNNPLKVGGTEYKTGFGTHASSLITFALDGSYESLEGACGVDDETNGAGSVQFLIKSVVPAANAKLRASVSPRFDKNGLAIAKTPDSSPWRVIIIAPKAINLVDQTITMNLSRPTAEGDWSWIQPGIGSWDWWNDSNRNMTTEAVKPFIDFAAEMGWQFHFLDDPWYAGKKYRMGDPRNNVLKGSDETDIEELVRYAKEKNVRLWLWLNWKDIDRQMDEAFALYEKWGIAGLKIDFMDRDDQEMVEWYDKVVQKAAKHKLMVNFHGAYKPTGYRRTYPNLITRESIYGNEQNKWARMTADHYCTLPYTRLMLGPGDFTPGAFLNRNFPGERIPGYNTAQGIGTRAHELAISFLYDSPILCLCDRPEIYRGQPGLEFYRNLPTVWDESHGIEGEIGEYFSLWRRKGSDYYYGAITDDSARTLSVPLTFLGEGTYEATIYADAEESQTDGRKIQIETKPVTSKDTLSVKMVSGGGQAVVFKKQSP